MVFLSFIIPFYRVEKFIGRCLESIYLQPVSEDDYEVICIDDCSPDHSREMVLDFQKHHKNLSLITNNENMRPGGCRNIGLAHAKGQYIWFVDSDDMITENSLSDFVDLCRKHRPDVLAFNFARVNSNNDFVNEGKTHPQLTQCQDGLSYIKQTFGTGYVYYIFGYPWSYIYRKDYLVGNDIFFPEKLLWEDTVPPAKALFSASKVFATNQVGYCYRINSESITEEYNAKRPAEYIYQYAFIAGKDVLDFAPTIPDRELRDVCMQLVCRYFNSFVLDLFRTSYAERKKFFNLYSTNRANLLYIFPYLKPLSRCMLTTCKQWNLLVADFGATFYKLTHKRK